MEKENGAGFRIVGFVKRKWISSARGLARITIDVPGESGERQAEVRSFGKDGLIDQIDKLQQGQRIQVSGLVESEKLTCKDPKGGYMTLKVDGYDKWVTVLTAKKIEVEASSVRAAKDPIGDDKMPGGW